MTLADIAGWLLLSWDTVKTVVQRRLEKDYQPIGYRKVHAIAIDELYLGRARKYITLVIDLESGRIIWVDQGRGRCGGRPSECEYLCSLGQNRSPVPWDAGV
jgi:transposase